jgi:hypothetical protein
MIRRPKTSKSVLSTARTRTDKKEEDKEDEREMNNKSVEVDEDKGRRYGASHGR